ncbi:lysin A [Mycobacterium phage Guo1]|uniref:endolysin n=1 Tax=Mycobacterium phage Leo TaxID=1327952 RepID=UPI00032B472F|nr:endolysin [Mycobacterium phage Leo]AGK85932.1 lysin A [Mycobacterium phage Chy3]AGK86327.1 lysin A [Mycobacterium phage Leo]AID18417.1 lysin A [Mycobacterium phage Guo1]
MADRFFPMRDGTYTLSSGFGARWGTQHRGLDFAAKDGTPIYAAQAGTVAYIGPAQGFGQWIVIDHPAADGAGTTVYGHMWNAFATGLKAGDRVQAGQLIAYVGANGQSTGPHLHFEVHPTVWRQGSQIDPPPWLHGSRNPGDAPAPAPADPPASAPLGGQRMQDPFTGEVWSPNRSVRQKPAPRWIAIHTQEGGRTARDLCEGWLAKRESQVSYHVAVDDREILKVVAESDRPWAAANANDYAFHVVAAGSYAGWSRGKWLETDASDGKNEDVELTNLAKVCAWWCQKYGIPAEWIGGRGVPWGLDGICGHEDFGAWGGGHHDPGPGFPADELIRRVRALLGGSTPEPLPPAPPVALPGTNPDQYAGVLLYRGRPGQDPRQVRVLQTRLKRAYSKLDVDGIFGPHTEACVRDYQHLHPPLVADGIVGPATAAALGLVF